MKRSVPFKCLAEPEYLERVLRDPAAAARELASQGQTASLLSALDRATASARRYSDLQRTATRLGAGTPPEGGPLRCPRRP